MTLPPKHQKQFTFHLWVGLLWLLLGWPVGRAAPITVRGLPKEEASLLIATLKPRLEFIESRPATSFRADDAAYLLERLLLRRGYPNSSVTPSIEGGAIILSINSGPRYRIGPLNIQSPKLPGLDEKKIEAYFFQPLVERELIRRDKAPYIAGYEFEGADNVTQYLNSIGYWSATTEVSEPQFNREQGFVRFSIGVHPGFLYKMSRPKLILPGRTPPDLRTRLDELEGKDATAANLKQVRKTIRNYYQEKGFEFANIKIDIRHNQGISTVISEVDPGRRFRVGESSVEGLELTEERRFLRPFRELKGKPYNSKSIDRTVSKLLKTGAFSSIRVTTLPDQTEDLKLRVDAIEGKARGYNFYAGIGSVEGPILGLGYYDHNFLGKLYDFSTRAEISGLGLLGEVKIVEPFFLGESIGFTTRLSIQQRIFDEYDKTETGLEFSWDYNFTPEIQLDLFTQLALTNIEAGNLPISLIGQNNYLAASIGAEIKFDYRDNPAVPTRGWYSSSSLELFEIIGDESSLPFAKLATSASLFHPIKETWQLSAGARSGLIFPLGDSAELPIDERFFIGGPDSVRSFPWRDLGPRPVTPPINQSIGGEAYWLANVELQRQIAGPLWAVAFADAGSNNRRVEEIFSGDPEFAAGLGLRLRLPVGPVRLEYGHNLTRDPGEPSGTWHFAIGVAF